MKTLDPSNLREELVMQVRTKLGNRLRNLEIRLSDDEITLTGNAPTFHVKQLAQHTVWELVPNARLVNAIVVA